MKWWMWTFDGIAATAVVAAVGFLLKRYVFRDPAPAAVTQSIKAGDGSRNVQSGGDVTYTEGAGDAGQPGPQ